MNKKKEILILIIVLFAAIILALPEYISGVKEYDKKNQALRTGDENLILAKPEEEGLYTSVLNRSRSLFQNSNVLSFLVLKNEKLVYEKYYNKADMNSYYNIYSITNSVISTLIGIAVDRGLIPSVNTSLSRYLSRGVSSKIPVDDISIENLLTMTAGFPENFPSYSLSLNSGVFMEYALDTPLAFAPGEKFLFSNTSPHMLSVILSESTGMSTEDFLKENVFDKIGITEYKWSRDANGYNYGSHDLFLRPRDMLKLGLVYLNEGSINGREIISREWIRKSTEKKIDTHDDSKGNDSVGYGYHWWLDSIEGYDYYTAIGYGGQFICVVRELDLVVVVTSKTTMPELGQTEPEIKGILKNIVIPALIQ